MSAMVAFSKEEKVELINLMVKATHWADLSDTYHMGYFVSGEATELSDAFGRDITRRQIVIEILKLKDHLFNFLSFTKLSRVHYDEEENRVVVQECYDKQYTETPQTRTWRTGGEPLYQDLRGIFLEMKADRADFGWLLRSYQTNEGLWLYKTEEMPQRMTGLEEILRREKGSAGF